jgi:hypothetical protein
MNDYLYPFSASCAGIYLAIGIYHLYCWGLIKGNYNTGKATAIVNAILIPLCLFGWPIVHLRIWQRKDK